MDMRQMSVDVFEVACQTDASTPQPPIKFGNLRLARVDCLAHRNHKLAQLSVTNRHHRQRTLAIASQARNGKPGPSAR
jgi:hypothetical protein